MIDIKLQLDESLNNYDINFDSDGDFEQVSSFDTSVLLSLGTDQRADESEIPEASKRRGWVGDQLYTSFKVGSKLWLLEQSRLNTNTRNLAKTYSESALQWLKDDEYLNTINVSTIVSNNQNIIINIIGNAINNKNEWSYTLWKNTGDSN